MSFIQPSYLSGKRCQSTMSENYMCTGNDKKISLQITSCNKYQYRILILQKSENLVLTKAENAKI